MSTTSLFPQIEPQARVRRSRYICDTLRGMIASGQLKPGDRLPTEEELCKHFKVSRTTLREAVQMLRFSGLLRVSPGRGSYVQQPDLNSLLDDIALYSKTLGGTYAEAKNFSIKTLENALLTSHKAPLDKRRALFDHIVHRQDMPEQAEKREREWQVTLMSLTENRIAVIVLEMLLAIQKEERIKKFSDPDEVMRTIQTQIRLNSAIVEGELEVAQRVLRSYLGGDDVSESLS
ncbi:MAG: GntR family transcriptional regulator, partial [Alphaproteobacteria bacterium]|nr:GntR family transcriptional regulator [Alphaproteobacteria bacterium]